MYNFYAHLPAMIQKIIFKIALNAGRLGIAWNLADYASSDICDDLMTECDIAAGYHITPFSVPK
jgi:hypothetical protein